MALTRELLKEMGLEEDVIEKVFQEHGKSIESLKEEKEGANRERKALEMDNTALNEQLQAANKTIEGFKSVDVDKIKQEAEDYRQKFEETQRAKDEELKALNLSFEIEKALISSKAKNLKATKALLDHDVLKSSNDLTKDLSMQIEALKESDGYLFETEEAGTPKVVGASNTLGESERPLTYSEMIAKLEVNPNYKF